MHTGRIDSPDDSNRRDPDADKAPEAPPDEPRPPRVDEPPPHQDQKGPQRPYVVHPHTQTRAGSGPQASDGGAAVITGERKERRGFASMSPEKQREIASKGGRAAHEKGTAHEWTADEARSAGRKGGQVSRGGRGRLSPADFTEDGPSAPMPGTESTPNRPE